MPSFLAEIYRAILGSISNPLPLGSRNSSVPPLSLPSSFNPFPRREPLPVRSTHYQRVRRIGSGAYGKVYSAIEKATGNPLVLKVCPLGEDRNYYLQNEIQINSELNHIGIPKFYGYFCETEKEEDTSVIIVLVVLVFELILGDNLHTLITGKNEEDRPLPGIVFPESDVKQILRSLLDILEYIHSRGVIHRDVKLENILLVREGFTIQRVYLIDYGLAEYKNPDLFDFVGTLYYISPEMIAGQCYDEKVDIWALGVVLVELLTGHTPFNDDDLEMIRNFPEEPRYRRIFKYPLLNPIQDPECRQLLSSMLSVSPTRRASIAQIRASPWLLKECSHSK